MADLTALREIRRAYINAEADKIVDFMIERKLMQDTLSTCDAPNWDTELHHAMPEITRVLREKGIHSTYTINFGVTDWVFTVML